MAHPAIWKELVARSDKKNAPQKAIKTTRNTKLKREISRYTILASVFVYNPVVLEREARKWHIHLVMEKLHDSTVIHGNYNASPCETERSNPLGIKVGKSLEDGPNYVLLGACRSVIGRLSASYR